MSTTLRGVLLPLEIATAACAAFNLAFFTHRAGSVDERPARRVSSFAMALVSLGAVCEALLLAAGTVEIPSGVRAPSVLGTALLSALILRYLVVTR